MVVTEQAFSRDLFAGTAVDVRAPGLEDAVRNVCRRELDPVVDEMRVDDVPGFPLFGGRCHGLFIVADRINCTLTLGSDVVGPLSGNLVLASPRSYRPPPTSAGSGGGNGVVGVVVGGGAAGAAGVPGLWKSTTGSSRITLSPKLITRDLAVSR
jgi:hypothetical protein